MREYIELKNGSRIPRLGMGTWCMGELKKKEAEEIESLRAGLDAGLRLIDTAEMYGSGLSEQLIGKAMKGYNRDEIFLVSKIYPHNAGMKKIRKSLETSLRHLQTDYLDLYLLHWRGSIPLSETVECMEMLVQEGIIKNWGVSNFDIDDMEELFTIPGGNNCAVNQVLYHLGSRGIEYDLLPWLKEHNVATMAYCPLAQAGDLRKALLSNEILYQIAAKHSITVVQLLLAFVLQDENVAAIPKSGNKKHVLENYSVKDLQITKEDMRRLNQEFPAPKMKVSLDIV